MADPHIYKREQIPEDDNGHLMALALMAKKQHQPSATELSNEEVDGLAYHVFKNWNTHMAPRIPVMRKNIVNNSCMLIGKFTDDLPPRAVSAAIWNKDHNLDKPMGILAGQEKTQPPQKDQVRRKDKPVFLRASLTSKGQGLVFDYVNVKGKLAPIDFVKLSNGGTRQTADTAHRSIVAQWNRDLCIYLWQWRLYDFANVELYSPSALSVRSFTFRDYVKPTLISDTIGAMIADLTECRRPMNSRPPREYKILHFAG